MKKKTSSHTLARNHSSGHQPSLNMPSLIAEIGHGARQPPRKSVVATAETLIMLMYSARKNHANFIDEYSVWKPPTSSPSASGRSNGARLVSPTMDATYTRNAGTSAMPHHNCSWESTICDVDMEPATMKTLTSERPMASS